MKKLLFVLCISIFAIACNSEKDEVSNLVELIPDNSLYIIDTPDIENFLKQTDTIEFFQNYGSIFTPGIKAQIQTLNTYSKQKAALISINRHENGELNYIFLAKEYPGEIRTNSIKNKSLETLIYKDFTIQKYVIEGISIFKAEKQGVFIAGSSRQQVEQILEKDYLGLATDELFIKAHSAIDRDKTSILLSSPALSDLLSQSFKNTAFPEIDLAKWSVIDIDSKSNVLSLNGISTWNEERRYLLETFSNTGFQINEMGKVTPRDARGFLSFTYQDIDLLYNNLKLFSNSGASIPSNHFLHYTEEAGLITLNKGNKLPVLKASDPELAKDLLIPMQEADSFRGNTIYVLPDAWDTFSYLQPLLPDLEVSYYIWIEDFIIFAENRTDLEQVISSFQNNLTLTQEEYYVTAMENLAAASSLLIVANNEIKSSAPASGNSYSAIAGNGYPIITMQFVVEENFAHIHGAFGLPGDHSSTFASQIATINLDAPIGTLAFPVKNPINNQVEVMVQDEENMLYLFSSSGTLIWKKQFPHQITGEIQKVDISKNGNLHYAFSTPYALHIIDRKGNPVKPFPLEFSDEITQPLAVFDYDNNRTYRFVLTQGNNVLMYDVKGKLVRGFDFDKLSSQIIQPPKHIRLNNKDYIIVPESSGKLNILSRQGKSRIEVKKAIDFSGAAWFSHKNKFLSLSSKGDLLTVSENGNVSTETVGENGNLRIAANEDLLVTMADNTLKINDRAVNLDYGLYSNPTIFTTGQKTYISITDTQAQRVYIFDDKANLLPGFPLYGNSEVRSLSNGKSTNIFSVQGDNNEIILYQF